MVPPGNFTRPPGRLGTTTYPTYICVPSLPFASHHLHSQNPTHNSHHSPLHFRTCKASVLRLASPKPTYLFLLFLASDPVAQTLLAATAKKKKCLSSVSPPGAPRPPSSVPPPSVPPSPGPSSLPVLPLALRRVCGPSTTRNPLRSSAPGETRLPRLSHLPTTFPAREDALDRTMSRHNLNGRVQWGVNWVRI